MSRGCNRATDTTLTDPEEDVQIFVPILDESIVGQATRGHGGSVFSVDVSDE